MTQQQSILITGGTGKTGRRIVERLQAHNVSARIGSRSANPVFNWEDESTWSDALDGMDAVYIAYQPDLAIPGAVDVIQKFVDLAVKSGVQRLVLLSGRGEEEAERCEKIVQQSGVEWTILRASFFSQNFSEGFFMESILAGEVILPVDDVKEPFVDVDDIADVAVIALAEDGHAGKLYELTGARLMTFAEATAEIAEATGREINYIQVPAEAYKQGMRDADMPEEIIWLADYLFTTVLDGRNESTCDGVQQALGREPRDFSDYARDVAATGIWNSETIS